MDAFLARAKTRESERERESSRVIGSRKSVSTIRASYCRARVALADKLPSNECTRPRERAAACELPRELGSIPLERKRVKFVERRIKGKQLRNEIIFRVRTSARTHPSTLRIIVDGIARVITSRYGY